MSLDSRDTFNPTIFVSRPVDGGADNAGGKPAGTPPILQPLNHPVKL